MGKRKHKDDDPDIICRKIRRLEKKLRRSKRYEDRDHSSDTSSSQTASERRYSVERSIPDLESVLYSDEDYPEPSLASAVRAIGPIPHQDPESVTVPLPISTPLAQTSTSLPGSSLPSPPGLPDEILEMLGEARKPVLILGEKIPKEVSERWEKILLDGLGKEQKESLLEKMLMPENFLLARAPKLNPEVSAVLTDAIKNRDKRLEKSQNQLGSGIAGLVNLTKDLIQSDISKLDIIKRLSEVSQILLDLHYEETLNRRKLIMPLLDKSFWNTVQGVKRETHLFGDNLGDNIKNAKDIEKSSRQIKKPLTTRPNFQRKTPMSGNVRFPPRQQNNLKPAGAAAAASNRFYDTQPSTSARRNTSSTGPRNYKPLANKPRDRRNR